MELPTLHPQTATFAALACLQGRTCAPPHSGRGPGAALLVQLLPFSEQPVGEFLLSFHKETRGFSPRHTSLRSHRGGIFSILHP